MLSEVIAKVLKELLNNKEEPEEKEGLIPGEVNKDKKGAAYSAMKMLSGEGKEEGENEEDAKEDEEDDEKVCMEKGDFEDEHTSLIDKLHRKDPEELDEEAESQSGELMDQEDISEEDEDYKKKGTGSDAIKIVIKQLKGEGKHGK